MVDHERLRKIEKAVVELDKMEDVRTLVVLLTPTTRNPPA